MAGANPSKWLGLLKWSMAYQDGTKPSEAKAMSDEDKKWFEQVMKECVLDEVERMTQIIRILKGECPRQVFGNGEETSETVEEVSDEELEEYKEGLLDELLVRIDQIDNAQTFVKLRGLPVILDLFTYQDNPSIRALAAEVFATLVQNNPKCQEAAMKAHALNHLVHLAQDEDENCSVKAMLGISCLIRGNAEAEAVFLSSDMDGIQVLIRAMEQNDSVRLQRKALFLLNYLFNNSTLAYPLILKKDCLVDLLLKFVEHDDVDFRENAIQFLSDLYSRDDACAKMCKAHESKLSQRIQERIKTLNSLQGQDAEDSRTEMELLTKFFSQLHQ